MIKYKELKLVLLYYNNILSSVDINYNWLYSNQNGSVQLYGSAGNGYYVLGECRFSEMKMLKLLVNYYTNNWANNSVSMHVYGKKI